MRHTPRICENCGKPFLPDYNISRPLFAKRRFCSVKCRGIAIRGTAAPWSAGPRLPTEERFWPKVDKLGPGECWEWLGKREPTGYGQFYRDGGKGTGKRQRMWKAHRYSWELHNGPVPSELFVLHHCDNPPCVNPAHLYVGTASDNALDRERRGRGAHYRHRLSDTEVDEIRRRASAGERQTDIAEAFEISQPHVSRIVRGVSRR